MLQIVIILLYLYIDKIWSKFTLLIFWKILYGAKSEYFGFVYDTGL
jgi:hypothetical protein